MNPTVTHSPAAANFDVEVAEERALPPLLAALPAFGSAFAITVGALVLVGWTLDLESLKRIAPAFVAMNPVTAVCFVFAGLALALSREHKNYPAIAGRLAARSPSSVRSSSSASRVTFIQVSMSCCLPQSLACRVTHCRTGWRRTPH